MQTACGCRASDSNATACCAITANAWPLAALTLPLAAETALAALRVARKAAGLAASDEKAFGFAAITAIAWLFWASAAKFGSAARARKLGFFDITSKASVCISCGIDVSPSVTSPEPICGFTWRWAGSDGSFHRPKRRIDPAEPISADGHGNDCCARYEIFSIGLA